MINVQVRLKNHHQGEILNKKVLKFFNGWVHD
jgi:hypothetical protein